MNQRGFILPNPYFLLAAGIAIAVSFGLGYWRGWQSGMENYYEFKADVEQAQESIRLDTERKMAAALQINERATAGWKSALVELDRAGRIRVQPVRCPAIMPTVPAATSRTDGPAVEYRPDPLDSITIEQCEIRVNNAVRDAVQVVHLQDFINRMHEATK